MLFKTLFSAKNIDSLDFLKALGILLVLINHSSWHNLQGGVNILILISGLNFARFSFKKDNVNITKDALRLLKKLLIPSCLLIIFYSILFRHFDWKELFLISNFFYPQKISAFPVWYVQVITQFLLVIIPLIFIFDFSHWTKTKPVLFCLMLLLITMIAPIALEHYVDSASLYWKLPHYIAWNFVLGWVIWATLYETQRTWQKQILTWVLSITSAYIVLQVYQPIPINRFIIFSGMLTLLIIFKTVKIPALTYRPIIILASAVFYIFLLHGGVMHWYVITFADTLSYGILSVSKFLVATITCCIFYVVVTAAINAFSIVNENNRSTKTS
jgi:hypothetical protein